MKINIKLLIKNKNNIPKINNIIKCINCISKYNKFNEINLIIVNKKLIKFINNKYRNINKVTNILTFKYKNIIKNKKYIGEIILCKKQIEYESHIKNIKLYNHWMHLIIHGCLHLLNINHKNYKSRILLYKIENYILNKIGIKNIHKKYE
ncbi:rRNA maturation RNase YbeY [Candidatus Nardonella dryophthoridicola]|uniref:Endoribonuclease YbeY n=1 Tax=endosymbiont of Rhynchophorus ferrugineus TaxID=1972133 RepID=A0A2Z5TPQ7_9GAMM|nr:rRNA maturation RNase YbeY [Candidatus Nardonella dryophthoridicola]QTJ62801.1 rRNA maturation RNase YbeY [Candidatus Nardonella dryophthoridicola]BBA85044.1 endoribonuclease YbeY [endosymbiont of Rhynchophorus ferrugineus]